MPDNETLQTQNPQEAVADVSGDPGRPSGLELEVFLRIGGEWKHMYALYLAPVECDDEDCQKDHDGSYNAHAGKITVAAGNDRELVVYEEEANSLEEALATLIEQTREEFE